MKVYFINLDISTSRLLTFMAHNRHLRDLVRFPATDGHQVDRADIARHGLIAPDLIYTAPQLGCLLSHLELWQRAIGDDEVITVCEDDAIFNHDFDSRSEDLVRSLPSGWHICLWAWNFDAFALFNLIPGVTECFVQFDQDAMRAGIRTFQAASILPTDIPLLHAFGTAAYAISPAGARALRSACLPVGNKTVSVPTVGEMQNNAVDVMLNSVYRSVKAFASFPPLAVTPNEHGLSTLPGRQ